MPGLPGNLESSEHSNERELRLSNIVITFGHADYKPRHDHGQLR
jgi:hypothetical protein